MGANAVTIYVREGKNGTFNVRFPPFAVLPSSRFDPPSSFTLTVTLSKPSPFSSTTRTLISKIWASTVDTDGCVVIQFLTCSTVACVLSLTSTSYSSACTVKPVARVASQVLEL